MATVPGELRLGESRVPRTRSLPPAAWFYFAAVVLATATAATPLLPHIHARTSGWTAFVVLSVCAALAQLFVVQTTRDQSYHTSTAFLIAGALLLPPELVVLMGVVQHVPEWLKHRYAWYIQTFNIANYTLDGLAAWGAARLVLGHAPNWVSGGTGVAVAGLAACVVFVGLNHVLMAGMLYLARGHRPSETGLFSRAMLSTEFVLASLGIGIAAFWHDNPALIPFALAPLLLIHRSLHVPRLEEQARIDPKTGLFNSRHFAAVITEELARAQRFERPASLIMADLDLLRDINNNYGHLVGDEVLAGVADVFREELRDYDVPARFGGEEFALLLPETSHEQALEIAERIRRAVARRVFDLANASEPVHVTISMGVATFPNDGKDPTELVHRADLAVYRAKLQGRNRVLGAGSEQLLVRADRAPRLIALPPEESIEAERRSRRVHVAHERRQNPAPAGRGPRLFAVSGLLAAVVGVKESAHRLLLTRTQTSHVPYTERSANQLREAAETIHTQNVSLEQANRLLRESSTAAMESLSVTMDKRDAYTAGHSRRVQKLALAIGRELDLSHAELDLLGHAALFHDIGKLAIPDAILLKPASLTEEEWELMQRHADEGARIIDRLGFLNDAVPAIRHHHERFDGTGYPDRLKGDEIPLGARIIHVADALDSMLTTRIYRAARPASEALDELRRAAGSQFCPRCVAALERILPLEGLDDGDARTRVLVAS
jgi:diguanylate cyclase (GGDEF)-like protein/putative nucleotidyltransferase with HDIG domain